MNATVNVSPAGDPDLEAERLLVERARTDAAAFAALYDRYVQCVYRYAFRRIGSHADAEDLTAQTFQRVLEALPHYESRGLPFGAWLFRIAHNQLIDRYRTRGRAVSLSQTQQSDDLPDTEGARPEKPLEEREELDAAWRAVERLPALQRRAVVLRFGHDLSHAEIGPIIGRSEAATKQLVYRALKTLRKRLQPEGKPQ
jgi:RNA polymerase sigma-70 factor (ECF subfamily)